LIYKIEIVRIKAHLKRRVIFMESPFDLSLILMFFVVFVYLYLMIINRCIHKNYFPFVRKDGEVDVERHFAGYKQK
jgi:hypothetical protein